MVRIAGEWCAGNRIECFVGELIDLGFDRFLCAGLDEDRLDGCHLVRREVAADKIQQIQLRLRRSFTGPRE